MVYSYGYGRLPADLHPPINTALAQAEAVFETRSPTGSRACGPTYKTLFCRRCPRRLPRTPDRRVSP